MTVPGEAVTATIPPEISAAIDQALSGLPKPDNPFELDRWRIVSRVAYFAAAPAIRAAAVEEERQNADTLKLGGMEIEVAAYRAQKALGMTEPLPGPAARALKDLYRAGVGAGLDIARSAVGPQPEAVAVIRAAVYAEVRHLARSRSGGRHRDWLNSVLDLLEDPQPARGGTP